LLSKFLKKRHPEVERAYVLGNSSIRDELGSLGILSDNQEEQDAKSFGYVNAFDINEDIKKDEDGKVPRFGAVVSTFDSRVNYWKMTYAISLIQKGAHWVAGKNVCDLAKKK
jgi:ribonucleotide monophosphatase NagD (HAD superfamily)